MTNWSLYWCACSDHKLVVWFSPGRGACSPPFPGGVFCFPYGVFHGDGCCFLSRLGCRVCVLRVLRALEFLCLFVFGFFFLLIFSGRRFFPRRLAGCSCFRFVSPVEGVSA